MKTIKYLLIFVLGITSLMSCLVEEEERSSANDQGPQVAGFADASHSIAGIANGDTYDFDLKMQVKGPNINDMQSDVTVNIEVDPSSSAIEGTHFSFSSKSVTLSRSNNYLGFLPITLLTAGINAPLAPEDVPTLYLRVSDANSNENVVGNGKLLQVNFNYLCFSDLAGLYDLITDRSNGASVAFPGEEITEVSTGYYKTTSIYRWAVGSIAPDQGFNFYDVCNVISVPDQDLAQGYYSNDVYETAPGSVDPVTGDLKIFYAVVFGSGPALCVGTYTKL
jgi:hypothetical protein